MKIIDLLNKIANGEEAPKKFIFANQTFEKQGSYIEDEAGDSIFDSMCTDFSNINDEIEIIEEDKEIEKLEVYQQITANGNEHNYINYNGSKYSISTPQRLIIENQNKLIDEVNKLKGE